MAKIERELKNSLFMVAVDYLFREKVVDSQKEFCERIGITAPTLSRIKSNDTTVSDATIRKMNEEFGGRFNMAYFRGESTYYLLSDLMDATMKKESAQKEQPAQTIDQSSLINAIIAGRDLTIAALEKNIVAKDETIASLHEQIKAKDELILSLRQQLNSVTTIHTPVIYKPNDDQGLLMAAEKM